jgi:transporter family-2 protein
VRLLVIATAVAGMLFALRSSLDARLGKELSQAMLAALDTSLAAAAGLVAYLLLARVPLPGWGQFQAVPPWVWLGGFCGGAAFLLVIRLTPPLGVGAVTALTTAGQAALSLAADHYGRPDLHSDASPLSLPRCGDGLGHSQRAVLAGVEHHGGGVLPRSAGIGPGAPRTAGYLQYRLG